MLINVRGNVTKWSRQISDNRWSDDRNSRSTVFVVYFGELAEARPVYHRMAVMLADKEMEMIVRRSGSTLIPGNILVLFLVKLRNGTKTSE